MSAARQQRDSAGDVLGIARVVVADRDRRMRRRRDDAGDVGGFVAVKDEPVFRERSRAARRDDRVEIDVVRTPVGGRELGACNEERCTELDERENASPHRRHAFDRTPCERLHAPEVDRRVLPSVRPLEVDQPTSSEIVLQRSRRFVVDGLPGPIGDGSEFSQQMVHGRFPISCRRSPMPRLSSRDSATAKGFNAGGATLVRVLLSVCSKGSSRSGISRIAVEL